ncbi:MAG: DUF262 domain-containing protein [Sulfuricaulis sp.]|uniref:GmrSD restriction endonuclease domain-containing protein n=1 Tax=Sulfuricaulis sp. TaxID=2003553 RepID=UPI0034A3D15F
MNLPEPVPMNYSTLLSDIEKGLVKIPQFQREFVWSRDKVAGLLDSIVKGYPIGTFILWKTKEELRSIRNLGNAKLPSTPKGDFTNYVLDGQQRLTSLFAGLKGLKIEREGHEENYAEIFIDLTATDFDQIVIADVDEHPKGTYIKLTDLIDGGAKLYKNFPEKFHERLDELRDRVRAYTFSAVLVRETPIEIATEIFTRLNVGGKPLSVFEIMVAKTFDAGKTFDLAERYKKLVGELAEVDYETISAETILQTLSCILVGECQKKHILGLKKGDVVAGWDQVVDAIRSAVDYFRTSLHVPVSKILPYNALVVPFAYFFFHFDKKPVGKRQQYLQDFFWRAALGARYSFALESKLAQDIKRMERIVKEKLPDYDYTIDISPKFILENGYFTTSRSYVKAILCLYASRRPRSFSNDAAVTLNNDWLKQGNSKNYHHFFPKAYMEKSNPDVSWDLVNNVVNITIVDDYLNKREIRAQPPSKYMHKFAGENKKLEETMRTHLIKLDQYGIWEDSFQRFIKKRAGWISRELQKRMISRAEDGKQALNFEDLDPAEVETAGTS